LKILSHSKSFEIALLSRRVQVPISIPLLLFLYLVPFLIYSMSNNGVPLKFGLAVIQVYQKWHILMPIGRPFYTALSCTIFKLVDVEEYPD